MSMPRLPATVTLSGPPSGKLVSFSIDRRSGMRKLLSFAGARVQRRLAA
jgi:hypothetical protein